MNVAFSPRLLFLASGSIYYNPDIQSNYYEEA